MSTSAWNDLDHPRDRVGRWAGKPEAAEINDRLEAPVPCPVVDPWADEESAAKYAAWVAEYGNVATNTPGCIDCHNCDGSGEVWTGVVERDTGAYVTTSCFRCDGLGEVRPSDQEEWEAWFAEFEAAEQAAYVGDPAGTSPGSASDDAIDSASVLWANNVSDEPPF